MNKEIKKTKKQAPLSETDIPPVKVSLRIFNTESIDAGTVDDTAKKWYAPYQVLSSFEGATNGMAQYQIELDKPSLVVPKGMKRPAGDFKIYVIYHIPHFENGVLSYTDRVFEVGYTVYNTHTTLSASEYSKESNRAVGVAKVAEDYGQVEAAGIINSAVWNADRNICEISFSGTASDAQQSSEIKDVKIRSKSMSKEDCETSSGKQASFGKLTYYHDSSAQGGDKALVDYDFDVDNNPVSLGGSVTIGDKVVTEGDSTLDNEYANTVNRGKRISSRKIDPENLEYMSVAGTPLAYNTTTKEFYNYDGTPLSSNQKKDIAKSLGTKYWNEWNHIGLDVTTNPDGTYTVTRTDGTTMTGTKLDDSLIPDLKSSAEKIRGSVLRELNQDRVTTSNHFTSWDEMKSTNKVNTYPYIFSNPQSKLDSDGVQTAYSTLGLDSTAKDYLVAGLGTAFDMSGSPGANVDKKAERKARKEAERAARKAEREAKNAEQKVVSSPAQTVNSAISETGISSLIGGARSDVKPSAENPLVVDRSNNLGRATTTIVSPASSSSTSSPSNVAPESVVTTHNFASSVGETPEETQVRQIMERRGTDVRGNKLVDGKASDDQVKDYLAVKHALDTARRR